MRRHAPRRIAHIMTKITKFFSSYKIYTSIYIKITTFVCDKSRLKEKP